MRSVKVPMFWAKLFPQWKGQTLNQFMMARRKEASEGKLFRGQQTATPEETNRILGLTQKLAVVRANGIMRKLKSRRRNVRVYNGVYFDNRIKKGRWRLYKTGRFTKPPF